MRTMPHVLSALCLMALLCSPFSSTAQAAAMLSADQGSGYSGQVLEKVAKNWQAPQYSSDHTVRVRVSIDGDGKVLSCKPEQSSNLALMDKSACAAVHAAEKFSPPPYGMPMDVFLTFWTGLPKGGSALGGTAEGRGTIDQNTLAQQNADAATAAALALAKAAEAKAAAASGQATPKNGKITVAPAGTATTGTSSGTGTDTADSQAPMHMVGIPAEIPSPEEARYAKKLAYLIREKMIIPIELAKGTYTFKMFLHLDSKGQIGKTEISQSSGQAIMDKYALRAIKRLPTLAVPPTKKSQDLHLTFVVRRP